ncbi:hypothetical protein SCO01_07140 [Staphylococcus cohnii subsp. cohnii]|nr:hypothetical protein SCO01_07140 [Staphylococcus cohnii subsp. cohnii]
MQNKKQGTHLLIAGRMIKQFITTARTDSIGTQDFGLAYFLYRYKLTKNIVLQIIINQKCYDNSIR